METLEHYWKSDFWRTCRQQYTLYRPPSLNHLTLISQMFEISRYDFAQAKAGIETQVILSVPSTGNTSAYIARQGSLNYHHRKLHRSKLKMKIQCYFVLVVSASDTTLSLLSPYWSKWPRNDEWHSKLVMEILLQATQMVFNSASQPQKLEAYLNYNYCQQICCSHPPLVHREPIMRHTNIMFRPNVVGTYMAFQNLFWRPHHDVSGNLRICVMMYLNKSSYE